MELKNDTLKFIEEVSRMCSHNEICGDCPLADNCIVNDYCLSQDECKTILRAVQKWSDEHPVKTYTQDFFEKFPNAKKDNSGKPYVCLKYIYGEEYEKGCRGMTCVDCWNRLMEE